MTQNLEFDGWIPNGFQERKIRRPRKKVPEWAVTERALKLRIFSRAMRRYRIAYLYWCCGWNAREVAEEVGMTKKQVEMVIFKLLKSENPT